MKPTFFPTVTMTAMAMMMMVVVFVTTTTMVTPASAQTADPCKWVWSAWSAWNPTCGEVFRFRWYVCPATDTVCCGPKPEPFNENDVGELAACPQNCPGGTVRKGTSSIRFPGLDDLSVGLHNVFLFNLRVKLAQTAFLYDCQILGMSSTYVNQVDVDLNTAEAKSVVDLVVSYGGLCINVGGTQTLCGQTADNSTRVRITTTAAPPPSNNNNNNGAQSSSSSSSSGEPSVGSLPWYAVVAIVGGALVIIGVSTYVVIRSRRSKQAEKQEKIKSFSEHAQEDPVFDSI